MSENEAFLSRILIFPIKSLDGVEVEQARLLSSGALEHDRSWALFDSQGKFVNGKRYAAVHRLRSKIDLEARTLTLHDASDRGLGTKRFPLDPDDHDLKSWLNEYFGFPVTLRANLDVGFPDDTDSPGPTMISVASLQEIGRWFDLPIEEVRARFRTNIEIGGVPPFWEDRLFGQAGTAVRFRIGDAVFEGINPCQRCIVPPRNPLTGELDDTFVRRFTELRNRMLPAWSTRERFNHFYRVAINTRTHGDQGGKFLRVGDKIEILDVPGSRERDVRVGSGTQPSDFWSGELVVDAVREETSNVRTVRLRHPSEGVLPFRFLPGQFLTISARDGTETVQRCYTIASSPSRTDYCEITVKREGKGSGLLHSLQLGSRLAISGPMGRFTFDGTGAEAIVLIAGGVGITPLMSKIRFLSDQKWTGRIDLVYSVKTSRDIIFREELAELERMFPSLRVHITLTSADETWTGARGRLSAEWLRETIPDLAHCLVHLCGPTAMATATQQILHRLGVPASNIEVEAFGGKADVPFDSVAECEVRFARSGRTAIVKGRTTLLEAALAAGVSLDHGCRAGVCGRCKTTLLEGEVAVDCDFVLTPEQKATGVVLTCQAHPLGPIALDC